MTKRNQHQIIVPDELWNEAKEATALNMSELVRILLRALVVGDITITIDGKVRGNDNR